MTEKQNIVLVHDWLTGMRGGERVLEVLCNQFPQAPIFTLFYNSEKIAESIKKHKITTSWLQSIPGIFKYYRYLLPFFPIAIESLKVPPCDLLISTSHCVAKGVKTDKNTKHLCYCFTPMRYAWTFYDEYFGGHPMKKILLKPLLRYLRYWDQRTANKVDRFVAISEYVRQRIFDFYGHQADVVYPPVNTKWLTIGDNSNSKNYDLVVSALVPYKRIDLAVAAYAKLGWPLKIVGTGPEYEKLRSILTPQIEFLGWQSDLAVRDLYRNCRALIFPGEEDFGIVPVEAQACGRPVVAYAKGGVLETVIDNVSGVFFYNQTTEDLINAVQKCSSINWDQQLIRKNAERFSAHNFLNGIIRIIGEMRNGSN